MTDNKETLQPFSTEERKIVRREVTEDGFEIILTKSSAGDYTLGWKKRIYDNIYGNYIRITEPCDIDAAYEEYVAIVLENARLTEATLKKQKGGQQCQKNT